MLLQTLACICAPFTKSTIINLSGKVGEKMKNSKSFIEKYSQKGIVSEIPSLYGTNEYIIVPQLWENIIRAINPEYIKPITDIVRKNVPYAIPDLALSAYLFMHGKDFIAPLEDVNATDAEDNISPWLLTVIREMAKSDTNLDFIKNLSHHYLEILIDQHILKLKSLNFCDHDLLVSKQLFLENMNCDKEERDFISTLEAFFNDFVKHADIEKAAKGLTKDSAYSTCFQAFLLIQQGDYEKALKLFNARLRAASYQYFYDDILDFYYGVALANSKAASAQTKIKKLLHDYNFGDETTATTKLLLLIAKGQKDDINIKEYLNSTYGLIDEALIALIAKHYCLPLPKTFNDTLDKVDKAGIKLLQMEMAADFDRYKNLKAGNLKPTLPIHVEREKWDIKLDELLELNGQKATGKKTAAKGESQQRIVYEVDPWSLSIQPKLQKSKDGVSWTSGRNIALEKMQKGIADGMTETDRIIGTHVKAYSDGWYGGVTYELGGTKAIAALVGHPYVFNSRSGNHIEVVEEKPQLSVKMKKGMYVISSSIKTNDISCGFHVTAEGNKIKVTKVTTNAKKTIDTLENLSIPETAKDRLTQLLKLLSGDMVVMGDLLKNNDIATRQSHAEIIARLQPLGDTISCQLVVRPFGKVPPTCKPGKGMQTITTTIEGKQVQTKRNLKKEKENFEQIQQLMVDFEEDPSDEYCWILLPEECLLLLEKLQDLKGIAYAEWPEGEKLKVTRPQLTHKDFNIKINSAANWFELSGDIEISAKKKMKIAELVEKAAQSKGNFIQLSDNEYVRLTAELRRHIDLLGRIASVARGKMKVSQFNAPMLETLNESGMTLDTDKAYNNLIERISNSDNAEIKIPKTINADLRNYQKEGFIWMSRLALWGAGALLADDMGLGKTLQAIALLLSRAHKGPQLIVVPTSVVMNWRDEIARFAPSLSVKILNTPGDDRNTIICKAKTFDIVIITYGLLSIEETLLTSRTWNTIVLDEAHTIKNRETKMSQSAMKLKADFRLMLTGTPLQNHVSEMWNLMQFANPDLLGSFADFTNRFLLPIERDHDKESQRQLKRIITPFILRRTKSEVLNELPEKTEITMKVDLSPDEWAFYDNIRQKALAEIEDHTASAMQALAEITRLRQAACNVRLVENTLDIPSSKLVNFMQLVDELHSNRHRTLVFSQFTSHLALVRERLEREGINYLYLDGSTSAKERISLCEEFQHGDMPLFLISLKAGGLGLNLTAADYVVHLDPWWNPAIEDQASDRAYRIGQHKPVTVYRLIASGTIEEKIITLHQTKKNMADALLEGGNISASMSREEMIELLKTAR